MIVNALIGGLVASIILLAAPTAINFFLYLRTFIDSLVVLSRLPLKLALQEYSQSDHAINGDINRLCAVYTEVSVVGDSVQVSIESDEGKHFMKLYTVLSPDDADNFAEEIKENARIARGN